MTTIDYYIDEYINEAGLPSAQLQQIETGKKIDLGFVTLQSVRISCGSSAA